MTPTSTPTATATATIAPSVSKRRARCRSSRYSTLIPAIANGDLSMLDPVNVSGVPALSAGPMATLDSATIPVFGEFSQNAPGSLSMQLVSRAPNGQLRWSGAAGQAIFGQYGDIPVACHIDADGIADRAVINRRTFTALSAVSSKSLVVQLRSYGTIQSFDCQDLDGDGIDELVLLHNYHIDPKTGARVKFGRYGGLSAISLATSKVIRSKALPEPALGLAVLDSDSDGSLDMCAYVNKSSIGQISCFLQAGGSKVIKTAKPIFGVVGGRFTHDPAYAGDGFAVSYRDATMQLLKPNGEVSLSSSSKQIGQTVGNAAGGGRISFPRCR
ncbi:MAG: hypothetical protein K1X83_11655 [Oligoflexia bacterium]|nr:hypothetical protein [Oligoflexia bacterium]